MTNNKFSEQKYISLLEDMIWQFAYRVVKEGKPALGSGGLRVLEEVFSILDWDNPHFVDEENTCSVENCSEWVVGGTFWSNDYILLCREHYDMCCQHQPRPVMKHNK